MTLYARRATPRSGTVFAVYPLMRTVLLTVLAAFRSGSGFRDVGTGSRSPSARRSRSHGARRLPYQPASPGDIRPWSDSCRQSGTNGARDEDGGARRSWCGCGA